MNNIKSKLPSFKYQSGIYTADKIQDSMKYSFKYGKVRGITTHIPKLDPHFSWKKGEVTCFTGWPQHGKTEFTYFLMLLMAYYSGWRWAIYSPENMSVDHEDKVSPGEIFDTLIHMLIGKSTDPALKNNQMSEAQYQIGIEFVSKHFFVVYPEEDHTLDTINDYLLYLSNSEKVDGWLKDPWNSISHPMVGEREDQYLSRVLAKENKHAKTKKIANVITAHPSGKPETNAAGEIIRPTQFNLSGGSMWGNKIDNCCCINRPYYLTDFADTRVDFHSLKIKKQKLVGLPGSVPMVFDRRVNQYFIDGNSPMYGAMEKINEEQIPF